MNIANALTGFRLLASPALLVPAIRGDEGWFLALFLVLELTDWLDGRLAVRLDQRTDLGARLDSVADMVMYAGLLAGLVLLEGEVLAAAWPWLAAALGGYALSWLASLVKFRRMPSYHTRSAKASYFLVLAAVVGLLAGDLVWPVWVAAAGVTVANLEAILVTLVLHAPRSDVPSVLAALEDRGEGAGLAGR